MNPLNPLRWFYLDITSDLASLLLRLLPFNKRYSFRLALYSSKARAQARRLLIDDIEKDNILK